MSYHLLNNPVSRLGGEVRRKQIKYTFRPPSVDQALGHLKSKKLSGSQKREGSHSLSPSLHLKEKCLKLLFWAIQNGEKNVSHKVLWVEKVSPQLHKSRSQEKLNFISLAPHRCAYWQIIWSRSEYLHLSQQCATEKTPGWKYMVCLPQSHSLQNIWAGKSQDSSKLRLC